VTTDERQAEHDIAKVLVRYATGIDGRDWDAFRTCFTDDFHGAYTDIGDWHGVDAITDYMIEAHADLGHTLHRLSNLAITVDGDTATARTYVDAILMAVDGQSGLNAIGFYDDALVHTGDGWRIRHRTYTMVHFQVVSP
jgi:3-phenylpropionate/cinnamic acid dioxygenase small subunit